MHDPIHSVAVTFILGSSTSLRVARRGAAARTAARPLTPPPVPPLQVICEPQTYPEVSKIAARLRNEYVVRITGVLRQRKDPNSKIPTGEVRP